MLETPMTVEFKKLADFLNKIKFNNDFYLKILQI